MAANIKEEKIMENKWRPVTDCDENGEHTLWVLEISENKFIWVELAVGDTYDIIDTDATTILINCKSFTSAKHWVSVNIDKLKRRNV